MQIGDKIQKKSMLFKHNIALSKHKLLNDNGTVTLPTHSRMLSSLVMGANAVYQGCRALYQRSSLLSSHGLGRAAMRRTHALPRGIGDTIVLHAVGHT